MSTLEILANDIARVRPALERALTIYEIEAVYKNSRDNSAQKSRSSLLDCFSVMDSLYDKSRALGRLGTLPAAIFSAYIASDYGSRILGSETGGKVKSQVRGLFNHEHIDFSKNYPLPRDDLLSIYSRYIANYSGQGLSNVTGQFYSWIKDESIVESSRHQSLNELFDTIDGKILGDYKFNGLSMRKNRVNNKDPELTWENFIGYEHVVNNFKDLLLIIKNEEYCLSLNTLKKDELLPKGILLVGPGGVGKTRLAKTFCNETGIPFEMFTLSDVADSYVNTTSNNIQDVCDTAAKYIKNGDSKFSLVFIDEVDSLGKTRTGKSNGGGEDEKMVTTLISSMDGLHAQPGVIFIGATNRPDLMDRYLLRPLRFGTRFYMGDLTKPDAKNMLTYLTSTGSKDIDVEGLINEFHRVGGKIESYYEEEAPLCTPAYYKDRVARVKRAKLISHLKDRSLDFKITTDDIRAELKRDR